jgi:type-F conjugative transfer system pilin assembly protein TrbC
MPRAALKALAERARLNQGVLVIRGLIDNSFVKTARFLQELGESVVLDPMLFKEYKVEVVPTFILKTSKGYSQIAGNISVDYALEHLRKSLL